MAAAETALAAHSSTMAVLPISELLQPDGWLAKFRAKGYEIIDP
jgi:hypothetical protein